MVARMPHAEKPKVTFIHLWNDSELFELASTGIFKGIHGHNIRFLIWEGLNLESH